MIIRWLPRALLAIRGIIARLEAESLQAALDQEERIHASIAHLDDNPDLGRRGRVPGTRELVVPRTPCIVIYRKVGEDLIDLITIIHGARRWPPRS